MSDNTATTTQVEQSGVSIVSGPTFTARALLTHAACIELHISESPLRQRIVGELDGIARDTEQRGAGPPQISSGCQTSDIRS